MPVIDEKLLEATKLDDLDEIISIMTHIQPIDVLMTLRNAQIDINQDILMSDYSLRQCNTDNKLESKLKELGKLCNKSKISFNCKILQTLQLCGAYNSTVKPYIDALYDYIEHKL